MNEQRSAPTCSNIERHFDHGVLQPRDPTATISWTELLGHLSDCGTCWLTAVADDRPHTRPVFAVRFDGVLAVTSSARAAKTRLLRGGNEASIATSTAGLDIVWTGTPRRITERRELIRVAETYRATYGWDVAVDDPGESLDAPYAAPTAGPPPYEVFCIDPHVVHAIATGPTFNGRSTRWTFVPAVSR